MQNKAPAANETQAAQETTKVFLSYSRKDRDFVTRLATALEARNDIQVFKDTEDILPTEEWRKRLEGLIGEADTVIFCLSPESAKSEVCAWEVEFAETLNKRIAPVVIRDVDGNVPAALSKLNYIFFTDRDNFDKAISILLTALSADITWIREHTRIGELARRWAERNHNDDELLRGIALDAAENWAIRRSKSAPELTEQQKNFLEKSRSTQNRIRARGRRRTQVALIGSLLAVVFMGWLSWTLYGQWQQGLRSESLYLARLAEDALNEGDIITSILLSLEGSKHGDLLDIFDYWSDLDLILRPRVAKNEQVFRQAMRSGGWYDKIITFKRSAANSIDISPDGKFIAVGYGSGDVIVWDIENAKTMHELRGQKPVLRHVRFSPDGKYLISVNDDGDARIWEAHSGKLHTVLSGHDDGIDAAVFLPDGEAVATAGSDGTVRFWTLESGDQVIEFKDEDDAFFNLQISDDGRYVAAGDPIKKSTKIWNIKTRALVTEISDQSTVEWTEFSPDGTLIAVAYFHYAKVYDVKTGKVLKKLSGHNGQLSKIKFSPDGRLIVTASHDQTAVIWDAQTGKKIQTLLGHKGYLTEVVFSKDSKDIATSSFGGTARIWDANTGKIKSVLKSNDGPYPINDVKFLADGKSIVTVSGDGTARLWSPIRGKDVVFSHKLSSNSFDLAITPDNKNIFVVHGTIGERWSLDPIDKTILKLPFQLGRTIAISPDGRRFASLQVKEENEGAVVIYDIKKGELVWSIDGYSWDVLDLGFSPDGQFLAVAEGSNVDIWEIEKQGEPIQLNAKNSLISSIAFSRDGSRMATSSTESLLIWDTRSGEKILEFPESTGSLKYCDNDKSILSSTADNTATLFDATTGQKKRVFAGHKGPIRDATCSTDGRLVFTASWDNTVKVWDTKTGKNVETLHGHSHRVSKVNLTSDNKSIISGSEDLTLRKWVAPLPYADLVKNGKSFVARCLTKWQRRTYNLEGDLPRWCKKLKKWSDHVGK